MIHTWAVLLQILDMLWVLALDFQQDRPIDRAPEAALLACQLDPLIYLHKGIPTPGDPAKCP